MDWDEYAHRANLGANRLIFEHHQETVADFIQFFDKQDRGSRILEVGCARGFFLVLLRELGFKCLKGADVSSVAVEAARNKGFDCSVLNILDDMRCRKNKELFDVVLFMDTIEHLKEPGLALENIRKYFLKKGGVLFLTTPVCDSIVEVIGRSVKRISRLESSRMLDETHIHAFSPDELKTLLGQAGFKTFEVKRLFCPIPYVRNQKIKSAISSILPEICRGRFLRITAESLAGNS